MSNEIPVRNRDAEYPRFPTQRLSSWGKSGPNTSPHKRGSGWTTGWYSCTRKETLLPGDWRSWNSRARWWIPRLSIEAVLIGKSVKAFIWGTNKSSPMYIGGQFGDFQFPRKGSQGDSFFPVPQTDTGGLVEKTKANERRRFKELGKKAGRKLCEMSCLSLCVAQK